MAKKQVFGDKLKKGKDADSGLNVKVIQGYRSETGTVKYYERFVRVADIKDVDSIDLRKQ